MITILGAGVIGLSTALVLAENGHKVKIVAAHLPDVAGSDGAPASYASAWAGAHFRPFPAKNNGEKRLAEYTFATQKFMNKLAETRPESSVQIIQGVDWLDEPDQFYQKYQGLCIPEFRVFERNRSAQGTSDDIDPFSTVPESVNWIASYKAWSVNAPMYIQWLYRELMFVHGVEFERRHVSSLKELFGNGSSIVVNCSGNGLQYDGTQDPLCFPIRGQTLLIRAPKAHRYNDATITHQGKDGNWTFMIPRGLHGGWILGGTKQIKETDSKPREEDTRAIIERGKRIFPELLSENGSFDVKRVNVGLRPAREGGSRVETERVTEGVVVHGYGCGGSGYEMSYGMALDISRLVEGAIRETKRSSKL
ncbi:D-amino-acid oxidase [Yarrowia sp. C11]|nr:D-amino-acid oxidase [Yarrowia sp. C11]KAG5370893.1 D-amino-acid oxidase [Yarrowia sp. E02]